MSTACTQTTQTPEAIPEDDIVIKSLVSAAYEGQKGIAELYQDAYRDKFIYDHTGGRWLVYGGHSWYVDYNNEHLKAVTVIQEGYLKPALFALTEKKKDLISINSGKDSDDISINQRKDHNDNLKKLEKDIKALNTAIQSLNNLYYRKAITEFAASGDDGLSTITDAFDKNPWLLGCKNGVIDLKDGTLRPGKPADYICKSAPTDYILNSECICFQKFLYEILNDDPEMVSFVQRVFGMALIGDSDLKQYVIVLSGRGRNGKNTLLDVISSVLGHEICPKITASTLLESKYGRGAGAATPEIMTLQGARLAYASETNEDGRFDVAKVKEITGGGFLRGRAVYGKNEVQFKSSHLLVLDTNHKPAADPSDYAFFQRLRLIDFALSFVDEPKEEFERQKDPELKSKLLAEAPGILNWLIQGCLEYQRIGLSEPPAVKAALQQYKDSIDIIGEFIRDRCNTAAIGEIRSSELYDCYRGWCNDSGVKAVSVQKFGRYMSLHFKKTENRDGKYYQGVVLR